MPPTWFFGLFPLLEDSDFLEIRDILVTFLHSERSIDEDDLASNSWFV